MEIFDERKITDIQRKSYDRNLASKTCVTDYPWFETRLHLCSTDVCLDKCVWKNYFKVFRNGAKQYGAYNGHWCSGSRCLV
jgi:hypothetical protein